MPTTSIFVANFNISFDEFTGVEMIVVLL